MFLARRFPSGPSFRLPDRPISGLWAAILRGLGWCDRQLEKRTVWLTAVVTIIALQTVLVVTHRAWLDEWQALQLSLQSPNLPALLENLRYEGHPPLWYLMLRGAALIVPAGVALVAVQLPIALGLEALILFKLPLSRFERLLFALNFYVVVDYMTISRSLGLGVLLFMAALVFRKRRAAWLAIALLPMVDFFFGVLSLVALAIYRREKRLWLPGLLLWLLLAIAAAWTVRPAADLVPASLHWVWWKELGIEISRFGAVLFPLQIQNGQLQWDGDLPFLLGAPLGLGFFFVGWKLCATRFYALTFAAFCAFLLAFSIGVYPLSARHVSLAGVLLVMLVAHGSEMGQRRFPSLFKTWLSAGALLGLIAAAVNLVTPFDTSVEAASYIRTHGLSSKHWAVYPDFESQGVSALTGMEFERIELNCTQTFVRWNYQSKIKSYAQLERALERISARQGGFYLISKFELPQRRLAHPDAFRLLAHVAAGYDGKDYYLYRVAPDLPERRADVPQCPPKRLPLHVAPVLIADR